MAGKESWPRPQHNNETATTGQQPSPWHSPVPYLFGGLAAMLGLIAFALLILACSYWKLSGYLENSGDNPNGGERDLEAGDDSKKAKPQVMEEKFLVIMAGDAKPTYLATLASTNNSSSASTSRSSSFMDTDKSCTCKDEDDEDHEEEDKEEEVGNQDDTSPQRPRSSQNI